MGKDISPIVTSVLTGAVAWVVDSIIFALGMSSVSISGALLTDVSLLRLSLRLLVFLCCLLVGVYVSYKGSKEEGALTGFRADELFDDAEYLQASGDGNFSGDDTLRGLSYVESVSKNPQVDLANRPIYFSEQIKKVFNQPVRKKSVQPVKAEKAMPHEDWQTSRYAAIQLNDSQLLWQYCGKLGSALKLDVKELAAMRTLCYAYDIGRHIDGATFEDHARRGAELCADVPELAHAAHLVATHHEKWDGSGIMGLSGLDIPLGSRIFALAWVYNAFTKPYGAWRLSTEDALDMLQMYAGTALDPELVAVFTGLLRQRSLAAEGMLEGARVRQLG